MMPACIDIHVQTCTHIRCRDHTPKHGQQDLWPQHRKWRDWAAGVCRKGGPAGTAPDCTSQAQCVGGLPEELA